MKPIEICEYIKNYVNNDKTRSAILMTGVWGSGKSYFIRKTLKDYFEDKVRDKQCLIVSLYGLKSINDINQRICVEKYIQKHNILKTESGKKVKVGIKTIWQGIFPQIKLSDNDLNDLFESVDLSDTLVVFDDFERTSINFDEIMGYINNLVENENVKVLIVANEKDIGEENCKGYSSQVKSNTSEKNENNTDKNAYWNLKEKTISDTLPYDGNQEEAIENIIKQFNNAHLETFLNSADIREIDGLLDTRNLRTFTFACQKTINILNIISCDERYIRNIFFSVIIFLQKIEYGSIPKWTEKVRISTELGNYKYPLLYFCYEYIKWHELNEEDIESDLKQYDSYLLYDRDSVTDNVNLNIINTYYVQSEDKVISALDNISSQLDKENVIPFYVYGKLARYLVDIYVLIQYDYSEIKRKMITNIQGKGDLIDKDLLFLGLSNFDEDDESLEEKVRLLGEFKSELEDAINKEQTSVENSYKEEYKPENISSCLNRVINYSNSHAIHKFLSKYDMEQTENLIFNCNAEQLEKYREILFTIYKYGTPGTYDREDYTFMITLRERILEKIKNSDVSEDRIVQMQLRYLCSNLETFSQRIKPV